MAFRCLNCGEAVENIQPMINRIAFKEIWCHLCKQIVSINGKHVRELEELTEDDIARSTPVNKDLYIFHAKTLHQRIIVRILNTFSLNEDEGFKALPRPKNERVNDNQYVLHSNEKLIGYLSFIPNWRRRNLPILSQIFIMPEERRKGYATILVNHFIERNCDKQSDILFIVEAPNEKMENLILQRLGLSGKVEVYQGY